MRLLWLLNIPRLLIDSRLTHGAAREFADFNLT